MWSVQASPYKGSPGEEHPHWLLATWDRSHIIIYQVAITHVFSFTREEEGSKAMPCPSLFSGPSLPSLTLIGTEGMTLRQPHPQCPLRWGRGESKLSLKRELWENLSLTIRSTRLDTESFTTRNIF